MFSTSQKKKKKILVGMSGGVDSSVVAHILVQEGYEVVGAYMKQWSDALDESGACTWKQDRRDAIRVAAHLGIPLLTYDFEKEYKETVFQYLLKEYTAARTPNPDVYCNKYVKFGFWLEKAKELGYDYLATGHYAKRSEHGGQFFLEQAVDSDKDQTYFLHQMNQDQISRTVFPLGELKKSEVRDIAKKANLPTANRAESMGICFIGELPMKEFLGEYIEKNPGDIVNAKSEVIGTHEGLAFYTIGQRHGFEQAGGGAPLFVVKKDVQKNQLIVGPQDDLLLHRDSAELIEMHWIFGVEPVFPLDCLVRLRHRQELQEVTVKKASSSLVELNFKQPQRAITPGQFAVFYKNGVCLGGGIIES